MSLNPLITMSKSRTVSRKRSSLGRFTLHMCLPLTLCLGSAAPGMAQSYTYGRAAGLNINPAIPNLNNNYKIDTTVDCPSPSFSIGGFVGTGNDRATLNEPYLLNSSNNNQYGVALGISVPFGGNLSQFCKDFATGRLERQRLDNENSHRNAQLVLIEQCYWLKTNGFLNDENQESFKKIAEFASLSPCFEINLVRDTASIVNPLPDQPPKTDVPPETKPEVIIQDERR